MSIIKCAFHIHTEFSLDCRTSLREVIEFCIHKNISSIIITDHNTIKGAIELKKVAPEGLQIIVGEEINTTEGEVMGLFLDKEICSGMSPEKTIEQIRCQNGIVCIPHPYDSFRKERLRENALNRIIDSVDILEVFNSRNLYAKDNERALKLAEKEKKIKISGSDAHTRDEIDSTVLKIQSFNSKEEFLLNLSLAEHITKKSSPFVHIITKGIKISNKFIKTKG
ncbi:MAG: PHP domain-containing protein [Candidatus Omnitrophica bacterium]|nr:PHP domain-containing protein [Candidatus Omnitrophota bacterium]